MGGWLSVVGRDSPGKNKNVRSNHTRPDFFTIDSRHKVKKVQKVTEVQKLQIVQKVQKLQNSTECTESTFGILLGYLWDPFEYFWDRKEEIQKSKNV